MFKNWSEFVTKESKEVVESEKMKEIKKSFPVPNSVLNIVYKLYGNKIASIKQGTLELENFLKEVVSRLEKHVATLDEIRHLADWLNAEDYQNNSNYHNEFDYNPKIKEILENTIKYIKWDVLTQIIK